jgi:hypothetical protein
MTTSFALITALGLPGAGTAFVLDKYPLLSIFWLMATKTFTTSRLIWHLYDLP